MHVQVHHFLFKAKPVKYAPEAKILPQLPEIELISFFSIRLDSLMLIGVLFAFKIIHLSQLKYHSGNSHTKYAHACEEENLHCDLDECRRSYFIVINDIYNYT